MTFMSRAVAEPIREDQFGEELQSLADELHIPVGTWMHYEREGVIPGEILLVFIEITHVHSHWPATSNRERFSDR
jgi:hypothetical protein